MKKLIPVLTIFIFVLTAFYCGGDSPEKFMADAMNGYMDFMDDVSEANDADSVAKAINKYAERYHEMQLKLLGLHNVSKTK